MIPNFFRFSPQQYTKLGAFILFCLLHSAVFGQRYLTAAGIRLDRGINITVQQYITKGWTAEGILHTSLRSEDLGFTLLAEKHQKVLFRGLNIYAGGGMHYFIDSGNERSTTTTINHNVIGISGIAGAEVSVGRLNVSVDLKPDIHFNSVDAFDWNGPAVSVRYIIAKRHRKGIDDWEVWDKFKKKEKKKKPFWKS